MEKRISEREKVSARRGRGGWRERERYGKERHVRYGKEVWKSET